jgi:hypothetical protein
MKLNPIIATAIVTAMLGLQAWTLATVFELSKDVAVLKSQTHLTKI